MLCLYALHAHVIILVVTIDICFFIDVFNYLLIPSFIHLLVYLLFQSFIYSSFFYGFEGEAVVNHKRVLLRDVFGTRGSCNGRTLHTKRLRGTVSVSRRDCQGSRPCAVSVLAKKKMVNLALLFHLFFSFSQTILWSFLLYYFFCYICFIFTFFVVSCLEIYVSMTKSETSVLRLIH